MRRRKPRVVWLPNSNTFSVDEGFNSWNIAVAAFDSTGTTSTNRAVIEVPIVQDGNQSDPLNATASLADIENSGYRLRRICGKLFCFIKNATGHGAVTGLFGVSAGFIIRRVDPGSGGSLAAAADATFGEIDPAHIRNNMDPWIWRRDWLLNDGESSTSTLPAENDNLSNVGNAANGAWANNLRSGSVAEGTHVDQKTARIVGPEERLFLDVSAQTIFANADTTNQLLILYQFRVLASMRQNIGNRRNASR